MSIHHSHFKDSKTFDSEFCKCKKKLNVPYIYPLHFMAAFMISKNENNVKRRRRKVLYRQKWDRLSMTSAVS